MTPQQAVERAREVLAGECIPLRYEANLLPQALDVVEAAEGLEGTVAPGISRIDTVTLNALYLSLAAFAAKVREVQP